VHPTDPFPSDSAPHHATPTRVRLFECALVDVDAILSTAATDRAVRVRCSYYVNI
jgi:hypothetical protein